MEGRVAGLTSDGGGATYIDLKLDYCKISR